MPFATLNNAWSDLSRYYNTLNNNGSFVGGPNNPNVTNSIKPEQPRTKFSSFDDGLIRGGILNAGLASARDTARVGNFLKSPKGLLWITKQVGLQLSNPLLETKAKVNIALDANNTPDLTSDKNSVTYEGNGLIPTRIYNSGINTLAQIPLNATGLHIVRHGLLPRPAGAGYDYEKITRENNLLSFQTTTNTSNQSYTYGEKFGVKSSSGTAAANLPTPPPPGQSIKIGSVTIYNNKNDSFFVGRTTDESVMYTSPQDAKSGTLSKAVEGFFSNTNALSNVTISAPKLKSPTTAYNLLPNRLIQNLNKIILGDITYKNGSNSVVLSHKFGGPQSVYGVGFTTIRTSPDQRTNITNSEADPKRNLLNGFIPIGYNPLSVLSFNSTQYNKELSYINPGKSISSTNGDVKNIEITYGISHAGNKNSLSTTRKVDSINVINVVSNKVFYDNKDKPSSEMASSGSAIDSSVKDNIGGVFGKDIIKFRIEFLNNASADSQNVLAFRAYIDDFSDGITANWNPYRYVGRGEEFYVYEGFSRSISVTFSIYAHNPEEMKPLYQKLNYLMSSFTPDYSNPGGKMRGNVGYLTIGDYITRQPGVFNDIKISNILDTHWEINDYELPKYFKVTLSFKPIHNFLPRLASTTGKNAPFVGNTILS